MMVFVFIGSTLAVGTEVQMKHGQRQLFLDDFAVEKISNLRRTMHSPEKKGAVIRPRTEIGLPMVQIRSGTIWDPRANVYRLWDCSTPSELHAQRIYTGGYNESKDGLHWYQPAIGQFEFRGSRDNNFVSVMIDGRYFRPDCAVFDPRETDPARRLKGLSFCSTPTSTALQKGTVLYPIASDGKTWKKIDGQTLSSCDEFNLSYDEGEGRFIATVKIGGPFGRCVGLLTSKDFLKWTDYGLVFNADERDQELGKQIIKKRFSDPILQHPVFNNPVDYNVDIYNMGVFRYEGLYIGLPAVFYATGKNKAGTNKDGFHIVQLVCSRDLRHWERLGDRKPFIGPSPLGAGAYDLTEIIGPSFPVVKENELWFYYTGIKNREPPPDADLDQGAVCLAVLRRDGFISLDAGKEEGWVLTKPVEITKGQLHLNVDASGGKAVVGLCDEKGAAIPGFEESAVIGGNFPDTVVAWPKGELRTLVGKKISLRITLHQARLYSFWIQ